jgi:predicted Zn finger-like uncharacterized protein
MIVECSHCHTKYNVDDNKIPAAGVKVRCKQCQNIIVIKKEEPQPVIPEVPVAPEAQAPVAPEAQAPEAPEAQAPSAPEAQAPSAPEAQAPSAAEPPQPEQPIEEPRPPGPEIPKPPEPELPPDAEKVVVSEPFKPPVSEMSEEDKRWHGRARRLAKALASDLVLYNKDKVAQGLSDGTLAELLGPEIRRSWEYYCQQIPKHIVDSTEYFKEQLNKIVGKGKEIFK